MLEDKVAKAIRTYPDFPKPGVEFKDVTPILSDVALTKEIVAEIAEAGRDMRVNAVAGIESRGFYFGPLIAQILGVPFIPIRKRGRFPGSKIAFYAYDLEYGSATMEMSPTDLPDDARIMIHDDLLATEATAIAAKLIRDAGGEIAMFAFLGILPELNGADKLVGYSPNIFTLTEL